MNTFDLLYAKSSAFGRDIFQYLVPGTMFLLVVAIPFICSNQEFTDTLEAFFKGSGWRTAAAVLLAVIVAYALGHVISSIGFLLRNRWRREMSKTEHVRKLKEAEEKLSELTKKTEPKAFESLSSEADVSLYCEIVTFKKDPELHAKFIERYNTLVFLRLGLASSFLVGGLLDVIHGIIAIFRLDGSSLWILLFSIILLWLGLLLFRQQIVTMTSFLNRLSVAYQVVSDDQS